MSKPTRPEITTGMMVNARTPLNHVGEPERVCANCEHFDGGGLKPDGTHVDQHGDCHNSISGKFQTHAKDLACARGFYPCTVRFPLPVRLGIVAEST